MKNKSLIIFMAVIIVGFLWCSPVRSIDFLIYNKFGGTWQDAEKDGSDDTQMCWAAAASNTLKWGGWEVPQFHNEGLIFDNFEDHFTDTGSIPDVAWNWWLKGTKPSYAPGWSYVDVDGGGNWWPGVTATGFIHSSFSASTTMQTIDNYLNAGYGTTLSIRGAGAAHEITVWGYKYHYDFYSGNKVYEGVYVTDSDDYVTALQYKSVTWNNTNSRWDLGGGTYIAYIWGLETNPNPLTAKYYFKYTYTDGDWYSGYVYAPMNYDYEFGAGYESNYKEYKKDESGHNGTYEITGIDIANSYSSSLNGKVYVEQYYDSESKLTLSVNGTGTNYLGSESGYIYNNSSVTGFRFGDYVVDPIEQLHANNEADMAQLYYFTYDYPTGDKYWGYGYCSPYYNKTGDTASVLAEGGFSSYGMYTIGNVYFGYDPALSMNKVYVYNYYDSETNSNLSVAGSSSGYIGSEVGYLYGVSRDGYKFGNGLLYTLFGREYYGNFEADTPKLYYFTYDYPNGDKYSGWGWADPDNAYVNGHTISMMSELGNGTYTITGTGNVNVDPTKYCGLVKVNLYTDSESGASLTVDASGSNYLGSEAGYLYGVLEAGYKFGYDYLYTLAGRKVYGILEADTPKRYYFTYDYPNGDKYSGYGYADPDHAYVKDYIISQMSEVGSGTYTITGTSNVNVDPKTYRGRVYVTQYYDAESKVTLSVSGKGTNYLASETGYLYGMNQASYQYGYGYLYTLLGMKVYGILEADLGDTYTFRYTYGNGDYYEGLVYRLPGEVYYPGYKSTKANELGLTGTYEIISMTYTGDSTKYKKVYVDNYHDGESNKDFTPVHKGTAVGTDSLGSELDYIGVDKAGVYKFGQGYYEADVGDKYLFRYYYMNGDYYGGFVYRTPGVGYYPGLKLVKKNETGNIGYYQILSMSYTGDTARYNQVILYTYHDGESKNNYMAVNKGTAVGTKLLGSEQDYIIKSGVAVYKFGQGYYEADVGDRYKFRYVYGNGDYYEGYVFRSPGLGYYPGWKTTKTNETGKPGYYEILAMSYTGDTANYNQVFVTTYVDGDRATPKTFTWVSSTTPLGTRMGTALLGSEAGYITAGGIAKHYFGKGYYEADE